MRGNFLRYKDPFRVNIITMRIHEIISPVNEGVIGTLTKGAVQAGKNAYSSISGRAVNPVHRIDPAPIDDFQKSLKTYHHTPNWHGSGTSPRPELTQSTRGLFAGDPKLVATYAVPRNVSSVAYIDPKTGQHVIVFNSADRASIQAYRPTLSTFDPKGFNRTLDKRSMGGSEYIAKTPNKPASQTTIEDPLKHLANNGWTVQFADNLSAIKNNLKQTGISHSAENL